VALQKTQINDICLQDVYYFGFCLININKASKTQLNSFERSFAIV